MEQGVSAGIVISIIIMTISAGIHVAFGKQVNLNNSYLLLLPPLCFPFKSLLGFKQTAGWIQVSSEDFSGVLQEDLDVPLSSLILPAAIYLYLHLTVCTDLRAVLWIGVTVT